MEAFGGASDDENRDLAGVCLGRELLAHNVPAHVGETEVKHDQIGRVAIEGVQGLETVSGFPHFEAGQCQTEAIHPPEVVVVLNDEYVLPRGHTRRIPELLPSLTIKPWQSFVIGSAERGAACGVPRCRETPPSNEQENLKIANRARRMGPEPGWRNWQTLGT
jgi:hypothetical protein